MKTMLNIKTDVKLKKEAQKVAKEMGLPLSTIMNHYLKQLIEEREVRFTAPLTPNARTARQLDKAIEDIKQSKNIIGPFDSAKQAIKELKK